MLEEEILLFVVVFVMISYKPIKLIELLLFVMLLFEEELLKNSNGLVEESMACVIHEELFVEAV